MLGNSFGRIFRVTTWGESHGPSIGVVIDGCPSGIPLTVQDFVEDLSRRQGGQGIHSTARKEADEVFIESGVFEGRTLGTPIALRIPNNNIQSKDYDQYRDVPRPGHADFTTMYKHEHRDHRGGGRSSARETVARVAAGVVARKILAAKNIEVMAFVCRIGEMQIPREEISSWEKVKVLREQNILRIPVANISPWLDLVETTKQSGDSLGGAIDCWVKGLPIGLGEPIFDKLNATLSHALMSLPAAVAVETGGGLNMSYKKGSEIRDPIVDGKIMGNNHGGLLGGMSSGNLLQCSLAFHAPTSIPRPVTSTNFKTKENIEITVGGRHDSVPLSRAVPMVEAMVMLCLVDAIALKAVFEH